MMELQNQQEIHCPGCGFEYTHPIRVEVNAGGHITIIDDTGTHKKLGPPAGRGVKITLSFWCENGCGFAMDLHFHKGMTFLTIREFEPTETTTIWRD